MYQRIDSEPANLSRCPKGPPFSVAPRMLHQRTHCCQGGDCGEQRHRSYQGVMAPTTPMGCFSTCRRDGARSSSGM